MTNEENLDYIQELLEHIHIPKEHNATLITYLLKIRDECDAVWTLDDAEKALEEIGYEDI